jgi:hypothetical protein
VRQVRQLNSLLTSASSATSKTLLRIYFRFLRVFFIFYSRIWIEFQNLAVRVRVGSASLDASIREWSTSPSPALPGSGSSPSVPSAAHNLKTADSKGESAVTLALSPASDHALAYSVLEDSGVHIIYIYIYIYIGSHQGDECCSNLFASFL